MEEPSLLMTMQRIIRRIEVEDDLRGRPPMRLQEHLDEQPLDRGRIMAHFMISRRHGPAQLQSVQRRLARQRRAVRPLCRQLAGQDRQHRIMPQFIVVVQVLIAQRDADNPLHHHRIDRVLDQF
jgi:hypothetical protein